MPLTSSTGGIQGARQLHIPNPSSPTHSLASYDHLQLDLSSASHFMFTSLVLANFIAILMKLEVN
jgi:hypothetical protein